MGNIGIWQILILGLVAVLLFGRGKISSIMGDVAKGINAFKRGMKEGETEEATKTIDADGRTVEMGRGEKAEQRSES